MVVLSASALPALRLTVDEYLDADLPEGNYELVNGIVEMPPAPEIDHEDARNILYQAMYDHRKKHPRAFAAIIQQSAVVIPGKDTVRQPDIALFSEWRRRAKDRKAWKQIAPFLVVEVVSPDEPARDYRHKREDYWLAGIREYWIVDPLKDRVTVLCRGERDWVETVTQPGQHARSTVLDGFSISVSELFGLAG